jgi:hypothetical protein
VQIGDLEFRSRTNELPDTIRSGSQLETQRIVDTDDESADKTDE